METECKIYQTCQDTHQIPHRMLSSPWRTVESDLVHFDDMTVDNVIRCLNARGNMIKKRFYVCSEVVKITLLRTYCFGFFLLCTVVG